MFVNCYFTLQVHDPPAGLVFVDALAPHCVNRPAHCYTVGGLGDTILVLLFRRSFEVPFLSLF